MLLGAFSYQFPVQTNTTYSEKCIRYGTPYLLLCTWLQVSLGGVHSLAIIIFLLINHWGGETNKILGAEPEKELAPAARFIDKFGKSNKIDASRR